MKILALTARGGNRIMAASMSQEPPGHSRAQSRRGTILALLLFATGLPLAVLGYLTYGVALPALGPAHGGRLIMLQLVTLAAAAGLVVGAFTLVAAWRRAGSRPEASGQSAVSATAREPAVSAAAARLAGDAAEIAAYELRLAEARKEIEALNARLQETSFKDDLTGLYNRRFFFVRLEEEISRHRRFNHPVAVVLFDLDGFKDVNDEQGHIIGDETLRDIGQILMKHSRGINVVSRYGGDEFAILLVETSKAGARLYADRIRQIIGGYPYSHGMRITGSFGVASLPEDEALTSEDLVRIADEQLYVAKRAGKNQVAGSRPPDRTG